MSKDPWTDPDPQPDDVNRLAALAAKRGKTIGEVLVELVREAA